MAAAGAIQWRQAKGLVEQVDERRVGALTGRVYALTAKVFRPSKRLLRSGDVEERADAITTLLFETTKSDLRRSIVSGEAVLDHGEDVRQLGLGRSIALLRPDRAAEFITELEALVARFDDAHESGANARPFALVWALYPSSRRVVES
jgi:hypothetical protein